MTETTRLIRDWRAGDDQAFDAVFTRVYDELRAIAHYRIAAQARGETLATTVLVHEAYVRLVGGAQAAPADRAHFLAIASRAMRFILVDRARARAAQKRGSGVAAVSLDDDRVASTDPAADELIILHDALERLSAFDARLAKVVECRFFGGMEHAEIAEVLDVSVPTVKRDWARARAWLYEFMSEGSD